jgi:hypothetical protein
MMRQKLQEKTRCRLVELTGLEKSAIHSGRFFSPSPEAGWLRTGELSCI